MILLRSSFHRRILVIGLGIFLSAVHGPLLAQAIGPQATVLAGNSEPRTLPDAPSASSRYRADLEARSDNSSSTAEASLQPPAQQDPAPPSLSDLGLTPAETEGNAQQQALMDKRTHMLKVHQRLGLITVIPVAAACISSIGAPPEHGQYGNTTSRDVHVAIGGVAIAMYALTASYAIRAPKVSNEPARGGVKWHKYLIYLHAPGMILTPILGAMAYNQINSGQKVTGIASAHGAVAAITAASYGAAIIAVSWPIHLKL
jgi:hypothetical protein